MTRFILYDASGVFRGPLAMDDAYSLVDPFLLVFWLWGPALGFHMARTVWTAHARRLAARLSPQRSRPEGLESLA